MALIIETKFDNLLNTFYFSVFLVKIENYEQKKTKIWTEAELLDTFSLERKIELSSLEQWTEVKEPAFNNFEQEFFDKLLILAKRGSDFWQEKTLKRRFISPLLAVLVKLEDIEKNRYEGFFDYTISATVEDIYLQTESDFILVKGVGDITKTPYFHFQEYKRSKKSPPSPWLNF